MSPLPRASPLLELLQRTDGGNSSLRPLDGPLEAADARSLFLLGHPFVALRLAAEREAPAWTLEALRAELAPRWWPRPRKSGLSL